ncbi:MAG: ABC transporter substrate-binding protein [Methanomassiliicoccales archaeon]|nr:MAG: ABC transporter substrate-binding protein [Methanomassiliicoccales archaeon]QLH74553.1 MAG: ABC transporter substrate-binding protein [Methanomassiliicoccales archaeon]
MKNKMITISIVCIVIVAGLAAAVYLSSRPSEEEEKGPARFVLEVYGNADLDEDIDEEDLDYVRSIISGELNTTEYADANNDGEINIADVAQIEDIIAHEQSILWIKDGNGNKVKVDYPIQKIGVEYLSNAELVRILGVQNLVAGLDFAPYKLKWFYFPEDNGAIVNMNNMFNPDYEFLTEQDFDLILTFSNAVTEKQEKLPNTNIIFLGLYWPNVIIPEDSRFLAGVMKAGYIFGKEDRAADYVDWLLGLRDMIYARTSNLTAEERPSVLMTSYNKYFRDGTTTNCATYTMIDPLSQMCILAGGDPIAKDLPDWSGANNVYSTTVDIEWVMTKNPEFIFTHTVRYTYGGAIMTPAYGYDMNDSAEMASAVSAMLSRPLLQNTDAYVSSNLYIIAGDFRNNAAGGILGAVYLAKILHPDLFSDLDPESIHQEYVTSWMGLSYDLSTHGVFIYPATD